MKIALMNEFSQASKNTVVLEQLNDVAGGLGHIVFNVGMSEQLREANKKLKQAAAEQKVGQNAPPPKTEAKPPAQVDTKAAWKCQTERLGFIQIL